MSLLSVQPDLQVDVIEDLEKQQKFTFELESVHFKNMLVQALYEISVPELKRILLTANSLFKSFIMWLYVKYSLVPGW